MVTLYVIQSQKKKYRYIGITNNLKRRLEQHNRSKKAYAPFKLILTEGFPNHEEARKREKFLKSGAGRKLLDTLH